MSDEPIRHVFKWCPVQKKVLPIEECADQMHEAAASVQYINDEMPPTKHPVDGFYYTSKAKFRAVTRAAGCEEVGTAYEHGWEPERARESDNRRLMDSLKAEYRRRMGGRAKD